MWKPSNSRADQQFAANQKKDDKLVKQKEKAERERDERMARLRDLRLAKETADLQPTPTAPAAEQPAVQLPDQGGSDDDVMARLPKVHPHRS